ncbi:hypothetical protein HDU97_008507 [Phlyctochytrium planicorne]|nr:hypothetical protein HDU97_008507 [Phlyctochytrium planicorne]
MHLKTHDKGFASPGPGGSDLVDNLRPDSNPTSPVSFTSDTDQPQSLAASYPSPLNTPGMSRRGIEHRRYSLQEFSSRRPSILSTLSDGDGNGFSDLLASEFGVDGGFESLMKTAMGGDCDNVDRAAMELEMRIFGGGGLEL